MVLHTRVSCSRTVASTRFIGIALAKVNTSASNSIVNPDPGRAHGSATSRTLCSGQRTRGTRACRNALCSKEIQMPPRLVVGVMHRAPIPPTAGLRAVEPGTARVAHMKIQPASVLGEDRVGHPPRLTQPQRRGEQPSSPVSISST
ncbi:hypothetical protein BH24ACT15_BH24ACT15_36980 [soil metagenome]